MLMDVVSKYTRAHLSAAVLEYRDGSWRSADVACYGLRQPDTNGRAHSVPPLPSPANCRAHTNFYQCIKSEYLVIKLCSIIAI